MASPVVCGRRNGRASIATDISACMVMIHHLLLLIMSTKGLQRGFTTHGRYNRLVYRASIPLGMPIFLNMTTDILLTMKYGIPSAKYSVGTHHHGPLFICIFLSVHPYNNVPKSVCNHILARPLRRLRSDRVLLRVPIHDLSTL